MRRRRAMSLLEIILALAILGGAMTVLGEIVRLGIDSAQIARDLTHAELLAESKLAELTAGVEVPTPVQGAALGTTAVAGEPDWLYSVELTPVDEEGLVALRVTVAQDMPPEKRPVTFSLVRWIVDPGVELSEEPVVEEE